MSLHPVGILPAAGAAAATRGTGVEAEAEVEIVVNIISAQQASPAVVPMSVMVLAAAALTLVQSTTVLPVVRAA